MTAQTPAQALGFPRAEGRPDAAAAQPTLALLPIDAANVQGAGGFEDLPVVLVAQIVVAYLGSPGWVEIRNLAQQYPGLSDTVRDAVNADPMFQPLGKLMSPMRAIALRDLLEALARDFNKATQQLYRAAMLPNSGCANPGRILSRRDPSRQRLSSQSALAQNNLRSRTWLPLVEQLVRQRVNGVRSEHTDLLALCDRMLAGQMPHDSREMDSAVASATAIGLKAKKWRKLVDAADCQAPGVGASRLDGDIALYRRDVLSNAFAGIASAFAAQADWSLDELMAESQSHPVTEHIF